MGDMDFTQAKATLRKRLSEVMADLGEKERIRITQSSIGTWYNDKIGEEFTVLHGSPFGHVVDNSADGEAGSNYYVDYKDAEYVTETKAQPTESLAEAQRKFTEATMQDNGPSDMVDQPAHYQNAGRFETIEMIEEITKGYDDGYVGMCVGNALKYLARAPYKHGEPTEDLRKAARYLAFATEYMEREARKEDAE